MSDYSSRKRLPLSNYLAEQIQLIVESRRKRGAIATFSSVASEVLSDCLPHYLAREEAIARGELACRQSITPPQSADPELPQLPRRIMPAAALPEANTTKKSSKRGQLSNFLNSNSKSNG